MHADADVSYVFRKTGSSASCTHDIACLVLSGLAQSPTMFTLTNEAGTGVHACARCLVRLPSGT